MNKKLKKGLIGGLELLAGAAIAYATGLAFNYEPEIMQKFAETSFVENSAYVGQILLDGVYSTSLAVPFLAAGSLIIKGGVDVYNSLVKKDKEIHLDWK